ncbi:hypothetical protein HanRHA438_Chr08g0371461 [Helianthus annuus]|nr:hypothetical protein HanRHA438_Chr08g0371461 [Helianthus annuus]
MRWDNMEQWGGAQHYTIVTVDIRVGFCIFVLIVEYFVVIVELCRDCLIDSPGLLNE